MARKFLFITAPERDPRNQSINQSIKSRRRDELQHHHSLPIAMPILQGADTEWE